MPSKLIHRVLAVSTVVAAACFCCRLSQFAFSQSPRTRAAAFAWADARSLRASYYSYFADFTKRPHVNDIEEYMALVDEIAARGLGEGVSLKPQQLGEAVAEQRDNTERVCLYAASKNVTCIVSAYRAEHALEEYETALVLIQRARELQLDSSRIGLCLVVDAPSFATQATRMRRVLDAGGLVRLVKGGWYSGSRAAFYSEWAHVTRRFAALAAVGVRHGFADRLVLATHDVAAMDAISRLTNRTHAELPFAMFRSAYGRHSTDAKVGIFYGPPMPLRQVFEDLGMVNLALRMVGVRAAGVDVSVEAMRAPLEEAYRLFG